MFRLEITIYKFQSWLHSETNQNVIKIHLKKKALLTQFLQIHVTLSQEVQNLLKIINFGRNYPAQVDQGLIICRKASAL